VAKAFKRDVKVEDPDYQPISIPDSYKETEDFRLTSNSDGFEKGKY
jgi:hypothetical protein